MSDIQNIRWTVALEAALFFSLPCWALATNRAWPSDNPGQFAVALIAGASLAFALCHVIPAISASSTVARLIGSRVGQVMRWPVGAWLCVGAMASLFQLSHLMGSMFVLWHDSPWLNQPVWKWVRMGIAIIYGSAALVIAFRHQSQRSISALGLGVGVILSISALLVQSAGLRITNPQMMSEDGLDVPLDVAKGMLMSAAPVAILAFRIGRTRPSGRIVIWSGFWGVWFPLLTSVGIVSLAKMCGARLYWKPSLPIEFTYAFFWLFRVTDVLAVFLWPLSLTVFGPCLVCAIWVRDLTSSWPGTWRKWIAIVVIAAAAYAVMTSFVWELYYRYWLWSIIVSSSLLGLIWLLHRVKAAFTKNLSIRG